VTDGGGKRQLFQRFAETGFQQLLAAQLTELADYLESRAVDTGLAAPLFLSQAINTVLTLFLEHDESGGVRVGFVRMLDDLVHTRLPEIEGSAPPMAARLARELRDEIRLNVADYNPHNTYES